MEIYIKRFEEPFLVSMKSKQWIICVYQYFFYFQSDFDLGGSKSFLINNATKVMPVSEVMGVKMIIDPII